LLPQAVIFGNVIRIIAGKTPSAKTASSWKSELIFLNYKASFALQKHAIPHNAGFAVETPITHERGAFEGEASRGLRMNLPGEVL
jgi:hypothetical protein